MKLRYLVASIITVSLLSSCGKKELRSDIKEFVASFSLSNSIETYKHAGYTNIKESFIDGVKTLENVTLEFNIKDENNPSYKYKSVIKVNEQDEIVKEKEVKKEDGKIFLHETDKEKIEYDFDKTKLLVRDFFYTQVLYEGTYHCNGMYYGDLVLETARDFQEFVRIDAENSLYIFYHFSEGKVDGKNAKVEQYYSVNKLGMLVKNISKQVNGDNYINQEMNVFCYE